MLWFTPPHVGTLISPIELLWSWAKHHYKKVPAAQRLTENASFTHLLEILKSVIDVAQYIHKPTMHTRATLIAARDFETPILQKGKESGAAPVLILELSQALYRYGRQLQYGEDEQPELHGAGPGQACIYWDGVFLKRADVHNVVHVADV